MKCYGYTLPEPPERPLEISCYVGGSDFDVFQAAVNQGIDAHLEGFTDSTFIVRGDRLYITVVPKEVPILLRRLEEMEPNSFNADEILSWCLDIMTHYYSMDID